MVCECECVCVCVRVRAKVEMAFLAAEKEAEMHRRMVLPVDPPIVMIMYR